MPEVISDPCQQVCLKIQFLAHYYSAYVNDFALYSEKFKFVTSTLETFSTNELNGNSASSINIELNKISEWLKLNRLTLNFKKTKNMLFKTSKKKVQTLLLQMDNKFIDKVLDFNFLGIVI